MTKSQLICDLTELFSGSLGRGGFYGIARVVAEIAYELGRIDPRLQYVVFCAGINRFIVVSFDFDLFAQGQPAQLGFSVQRLFFSLDQQLFRLKSVLPRGLYRWITVRLEHMVASKLLAQPRGGGDGVLFSAARPKFVASYFAALAHCGAPIPSIGTSKAPSTSRWKLASLLHDFFPLLDQHDRPGWRFVDQFAADNYSLVKHSSYLFANSHFTKDCFQDLQARGLMPQHGQIYVAQLAHECRVPRRTGSFDLPTGPFFLAVGCRPGRKNLAVLLEALLLLEEASLRPAGLVLAGAARSATRRLLGHPRYRVIRKRIQILVTPSQAELVALYQAATATVLPSFSEGWGLPASESLWLGTPVLAADTPVMHEVCGELALYFLPDDAYQLADLMQHFQDEPHFVAERKAAIQSSHFGLRCWAQTASDVASLVYSREASFGSTAGD